MLEAKNQPRVTMGLGYIFSSFKIPEHDNSSLSILLVLSSGTSES